MKIAQERGFSSWEAWRQSYLAKFQILNRDWILGEITPSKIPQIYAGPYSSWLKYAENREKSQFKHISEQLRENDKVKAILSDFPQKETELIGITNGDKIILIEGHHRCAAITLALQNRRKIKFKIKIALSIFTKDENVLFQDIFDGKFNA